MKRITLDNAQEFADAADQLASSAQDLSSMLADFISATEEGDSDDAAVILDEISGVVDELEVHMGDLGYQKEDPVTSTKTEPEDHPVWVALDEAHRISCYSFDDRFEDIIATAMCAVAIRIEETT